MANYQNIQEYRRKKRLKRIVRNLLLAAFIVILLFVLLNVLEVFKGSRLDQLLGNARLEETDQFPLTIKKEQLVDLHNVGDHIAVLTKSSILTYNSSGVREYGVTHGYTNPVMKENGKRLLTYDRGGLKLRVDTKNSEIGEVAVTSPIISADISESGRIAVAMKYKSNSPVIVVYNENLDIIYRNTVPEDFVSISFAEDENRIALAAVTSPTGVLSADFYTYDLTNPEKGETQTQVSGILPLLIAPQSGGGYILIGKDSAISINGSSQQRYEYTGALQHYALAGRDAVILINENIFNNYSVLSLLTRDGMPKGTIDIDDEVIDVYSDGARIAVLGKNALYNYDMSLKLLNRTPLSSTFRRVVYSGNAAYVMGEDTLEKYSME